MCLSLFVYGCVELCMTVFSHVWLCIKLCIAVYGYVWVCNMHVWVYGGSLQFYDHVHAMLMM